MASHFYALLVGINQYDKRSYISSLSGCANDIKAVQTYLEARTDESKTQLHLRTLLDEQATRQAIMDGFREHLQQASAGDTVLFYYAGHGSQNRAPQEFWPIEPDRLNETLVCYDSRIDGSWDLADKELSKLIYEVSQNNPHITIVLDCCHSGSGTRGEITPAVGKRRAPMDERDRPIESFIVSPEELAQQAKEQRANPSATRSLEASKTGWNLPQGRHVLIAACLDTEEASEHFDNGRSCGAFSYFLLDTLQKTNGSMTYQDLFSSVYARMRSQISIQSPQLEATYLEDIHQPFLGGAIAPFTPYFTLSYSNPHGWSINGGAVHGIPQPFDDQATQLAIFPFDSSPKAMQQLNGALAQAVITDVLPQLSRVQTDAVLDTGAVYKGVVTDLPLPSFGVTVEGDGEPVAAIREALQTSTKASSTRPIYEVADVSLAKFRVLARADDYLITRPADERPLIAPTSVRAVNAGELVLQNLSHLARWTTVAELTHPAASRLPTNAVEIHLYHLDQRQEATQLRLNYTQQGNQWQPPRFKAKLVNTTSRRLYGALLNLTEQYSISAPFFGSGGIWLEANSEAWATIMVGDRLSDLIPTTVPQSLWEQGVTEYQDILKLVASTAEFDPTLLLQSKLGAEPVGASRGAIAPPRSTGRLMRRVDTRDIGVAEAADTVDDWTTSQIAITTVRPQIAEAVSSSRNTPLSSRVVIQPHARLRAKARLARESVQMTCSLDTPSLPPLLRDCTQPLQFTASRGSDPGLDILELSEIIAAESVTAQTPLTLLVNTALSPGESVLPVAYDGEFFMPLGYSHRRGEQTEIVLQRLPQSSQDSLSVEDVSSDGEATTQTRSIGGTIRIYFRKVATQTLGETLSQKLGLSFEYPVLAAVEYLPVAAETETLSYLTDQADIKARVAQAKKIVLYIHGIAGDTRSMVPSIQTAHIEWNGQSKALSDVYDLVLTCDYESLNTSIATTAAQLKQRLAAVGLEPEHGKTLHIVAHSMGGLVSRWLIEKEGGDELVQHLIMLGTPNAGSPWPVVQAGLTKALSFAINGLSTVVWPLRLVSSVLHTLEAIDVALDEMEPGSELLAQLAASKPPIEYSIIAGNTRLIPADRETALRARLEEKLQRLFELPFLKEVNDIAVSVESVRQVSAGDRYAPQVREVACNHLVYFTDSAGLTGLSWAIARAFASNEQPLQGSSSKHSLGMQLSR